MKTKKQILKEFDEFFRGTTTIKAPSKELNLAIVKDFFSKALDEYKMEVIGEDSHINYHTEGNIDIFHKIDKDMGISLEWEKGYNKAKAEQRQTKEDV